MFKNIDTFIVTSYKNNETKLSPEKNTKQKKHGFSSREIPGKKHKENGFMNIDSFSGAQKSKNNYCSKGHQQSFSSQNLWVWGYHCLLTTLQENPSRVEYIFVKHHEDIEKLEKKLFSLFSYEEVKNILQEKLRIDSGFLRNIPQDAVHQGIGGIIKKPKTISLNDLDPQKGTILALDGISDPHNVGALWRSGAAMGAQALLLTKSNSPDITGTLLKCASGAENYLPYFYCNNFNETLGLLKKKGFFVVGLSDKGTTSLPQCTLNPVVIIVGGEGKGLRLLTQKTCDVLLSIPTTETFGVLNASVAGSIALYHFWNQK